MEPTKHPRTVFLSLLKEIKPETVVWRTMSGNFTAQQMIQEIELGSDDAKQYMSDFFRLVRDLLGRREPE